MIIEGLDLEMNVRSVFVRAVVLTVRLSWGRRSTVVVRRRPWLFLVVFMTLKARQILGASSRDRHVLINILLSNFRLTSVSLLWSLGVTLATCLLKLALHVRLLAR